MRPVRHLVTTANSTYYCTAHSAFAHALFEEELAFALFCSGLQEIITCFDCHIFAIAVEHDRFHLVIRHRQHLPFSDEKLLQLWHQHGGSPSAAVDRLRQRGTSLGGIMQTLLQRFGRRWHSEFGGQGRLWAERYHACILADDSAIAAAAVWCDRRPAVWRLKQDRTTAEHQGIRLRAIPLNAVTDDIIVPADDAPFGLPTGNSQDSSELFTHWSSQQSDASVACYQRALCHGWAMGRPESLIESTALLGRSSGRGRSRSIRELGDDLGLCGVWG